MTTRLSNVEYLTVLPPVGLDGVGWSVRVLSERDYASVVADLPWFVGLGFTVDGNAEGGATVTLDADDAVFTSPLPLGESTRVVDQEALWQILEDGQVRFEFLAEDVDQDVVTDNGTRTTVIAGRGTASVLEWAPVLPAGMPTPTSMTRTFNAHPMAVWYQLLLEAQAEGYLDWVSTTFDGTVDSHAAPWGPAQTLTVNAGDTLLDLLKRWADVNELTWRMLPGFRLEVVQGGGVHHEDKVVFTQYRSQGEHKRKITRRELANVIFADSGDNGLAFAEDGDSVSKWRKRAAWLSAGDAADASARSMVANTSLTLAKDQRLSRTVTLVPDKTGRQPFVDFDVHDWISVEVPDDDTESGVRKVVGLAVDINQDGVVEYEATLSSKFEVRAVKLKRLLDKLGGSERSGSGSDASSPIKVSKALSAVKLAGLSDVDLTSPATGSLLQWNGSRWIDAAPNLDMLTDADTGTIPGTGTVGLLYDRPSGLWKPTVLPAAGGGGSALDYVADFPAMTANLVAQSNSSCSKGTMFQVLTNCTITEFAMLADTLAGVVYKLHIFEMTITGASSATVAAVTWEASFTPGATTKAWHTRTGLSVNLDAGKAYCFAMTRTDTAAVIATYNTASADWSGGFMSLMSAFTQARAGFTNPVVGSAYGVVSSGGQASRFKARTR